MGKDIRFETKDRPAARMICELREAVGYQRNEEDYPVAFDRYDTTVSAYDENGALTGWCAAVTDDVRHGFFVDVIVHPEWQRRGIGASLVRQALDCLKEKGISIVHADFSQELSPFYESCGFRIGLGGVYEQ